MKVKVRALLAVLGVASACTFFSGNEHSSPPKEQAPVSSQRQEREIKLTLSPEAYGHLEAQLPASAHTVTQRNIYFADAQGILLAKPMSVRIRLYENEKAVLTIKSGGEAASKDGLFVRNEHECQFKSFALAMEVVAGKTSFAQVGAADCIPLKDSRQPLEILQEEIGQVPISVIGENTSIRKSYEQEIGGKTYTFELDKTTFPRGVVGYELEVEIPEGSQADVDAVTEYLKEHLKGDFAPSSESKFQVTMKLLRDPPV
jgi:uncharacterized protein YjbK